MSKITVYTERVFKPDKYPFQDDGEYWTQFYDKVRSGRFFLECLASVPIKDKKILVATALKTKPENITLMSKKEHYKLNKQP